MNIKPQVSVIVPIYNASRTIGTTLEALLGQTLPSTEIICVNDGSTDDSLNIIREIASRNSNILVVDKNNQGAFLAREEGIKHAKGDYIGFCDADDVPLPEMFEKLLMSAKNHGADMSVCSFTRADLSAGKEQAEMQDFPECISNVSQDKGWLACVNTSLWNKLIKRSAIEKRVIPRKPPRIMEDAFFLFSIYPNIETISFIDEPLYVYREQPGTAMSTVNTSEIESLFDSWKELRYAIGKEDKTNLQLLDLGAFVHLGLSMMMRLSDGQSADFKKICKRVTNELESSFPCHIGNPFLKPRYILSHNKMKFLGLAHFLYRVKAVYPLINVYSLIKRKAGNMIKLW